MGRLDGQHALVTGAGSGLGRVIAMALAREGARVAVEDLDKTRAEAVLTEIGGRGIVLEGDVAESETVKHWFEEISREFGNLEILVNNAGYVDARPEIQERLPIVMGELLSGQGQQTPLESTTHG